MICAAEEDLGRNSNMQQKKETFKEQMDRQDFHSHYSYVRAQRSPYLRQQISAGGEHILHILWHLCQGTPFPWHAVPAAKPCASLVGLKRCQVGASSMPAKRVILPAEVGMAWLGQGKGRHPDTPNCSFEQSLLLPLLELWALAVLLRGCRGWWGTWGSCLYQPLYSK